MWPDAVAGISSRISNFAFVLFCYITNHLIERLSMTFTADGKRQRLPLIFYSFLVILK